MRKTKAVTMTVALFTVLLLFAGCSNSDEKANGSSGKKTIEFMHLWPKGSSKTHYEIVNNIVKDYEKKHPDVKVDVQVLSNEQYKDKLKVLSTSNKLPDVGMTWAAGFMEPYVSGNKFAPLDDVINKNLKDQFVPGTAEAFAIDGKTYGMPLELNIATVFYNKAIFDKYGLKAPKTFDEFQHVVKTLKDNGVAPIALGNKDRWTGSLWYMYLADRIGGGDTMTNAINRSGSFEDPALVSAAKKVQDLVDMGAFEKGFNGLSDDEAKSMFMNGQAGMYLIGTWDLPNYTTNEDVPKEFRDSIDYFNFPTVDGKGDMNSFVGGPGVGLFVAQNSDVKEEAKDFAAFFVKEWGEKSVTDAGVIPATKIDAGSLDLPDMYVNVLNDLSKASNITLFADVQMSPDVAQVHLDMIQALFGKQVTPEKFAKEQEQALAKEK
ncbi:extracellular solute-binding protein [Falsibacillus albus]|uniref:Extracellular solute-binding protein n=1 Tax=Falsibacillus albus TaxID=2478915 RepID=A0A3L7JWK4_9BACI|nr:extracellular solute-binding protein [Falsibacillus albus]RLQ94634.1 extracellular solute-binding protein [Falsibacillus albus]